MTKAHAPIHPGEILLEEFIKREGVEAGEEREGVLHLATSGIGVEGAGQPQVVAERPFLLGGAGPADPEETNLAAG